MIAINNLTEVEVDEGWVKAIVEDVLKGEAVKGSREPARNAAPSDVGGVSIAFLGPGRMRKLNKQYRRKNKATDVLSFAEKEIPFEKFKIGQPKKHQGLGEIVVCLREVKKNARRENVEFTDELKRVLIHGALHLLGYDHEKSDVKANEMELKEEQYF